MGFSKNFENDLVSAQSGIGNLYILRFTNAAGIYIFTIFNSSCYAYDSFNFLINKLLNYYFNDKNRTNSNLTHLFQRFGTFSLYNLSFVKKHKFLNAK